MMTKIKPVIIRMAFYTGWLIIALIVQVACEREQEEYTYFRNVNSGPRIVSGWEAGPGEHPHQAIIRMVNPQGGVGSCDGTIVHERWALSAAHCLANQVTLVVRAGLTNLTYPEYIAETTTFYIHPDYDQDKLTTVQGSDIALIMLETPIIRSDRLQPIRVQSEVDAYRDYSGETVYASGFGRTWTGGPISEVLNWVYLTAISNQECRAIFGDFIRDTSVCARYYNVTSQSICQGDDGGPLVYVGGDGVPTLIGISSFVLGSNFGGCHSGQPGGFVRTGPFLPWMREITGENLDRLDEDITTTENPTTDDPTTKEWTTFGPITTEVAAVEIETEKPEKSEESVDENSLETEKDSSSETSSEEDPEFAKLLKRLEVEVLVKVKLEKKKHHVHKHVTKERH